MTATARLLRYVREVRRGYAMGALLTVGYALAFQLPPVFVREVVAHIEGRAPLDDVARAIAWLLGASVLVALLRLFSRLVLFRCAREIEFRLRNDLFAHLQRLPQSYFATQRTGDLMSRAVNDVNNVRLLLGMGILNLLQTPILYLGAIGVMLWVDWRLTLLFLIPYPATIAIARVFGHRIHRTSLAVQESLSDLSSVVQESASGALVVRCYGLEDRERRRFAEESDRLYDRQIDLAVVQAGMQSSLAPLLAVAQIVVLWAGGRYVTDGALGLQDLWLFFVYSFQLSFPTFMMGWVLNAAQRGLVGLERIGEVLDTVPAIADRPDTVAHERIRGAVEIRGLSFAYPGHESSPALCGVELFAEPGETIGIVGPIGSGKSTLLATIPRLLEVDDGRVWIDGVDVNRLPLALLRASIAMVPQESFLFSTTIAENIRFGRPDATMDEVCEAARRAHLLADVEDFPDGFHTLVGERGITLSGGQRQRVALARALLLDPAILILDDALSSVDAATEEAILLELRSARAGRTCFLVAHRMSAVRDADRIVALEAGRVTAVGTHADLVAGNGFYARTHRRQQIEAEIEGDAA